MPSITRPGRPTLHYTVDDYTDPWKPVPTVLLQHGYARNSAFWHGWVPYLARRYKVVRMDLRGHGESPVDFDPSTESTLDGYVGDLLALLDALDLCEVHYCGESFGGILGMVLAAEHPTRVRSLTLVAAPVYQNAQAAYSAGFPTREEALRTLGARKWAEAIYGAPGFFPPDTDPRLREWYVAQIASSDVEVLCGLYGLLRHANAQPYLSRIEAPVLGLYPTSGALTSSEQEDLLAAEIRDLRMIHLPTSSHAVLTLEPEACAAHLLTFIVEHDRSD
ncbi:MAG TPA: alpha/beta hydrolase [Burkholderiales bacterium]|nr:alpha/beta hydrolase [Burkholderiales bacterium]